jgi:hypothetical protein
VKIASSELLVQGDDDLVEDIDLEATLKQIQIEVDQLTNEQEFESFSTHTMIVNENEEQSNEHLIKMMRESELRYIADKIVEHNRTATVYQGDSQEVENGEENIDDEDGGILIEEESNSKSINDFSKVTGEKIASRENTEEARTEIVQEPTIEVEMTDSNFPSSRMASSLGRNVPDEIDPEYDDTSENVVFSSQK